MRTVPYLYKYTVMDACLVETESVACELILFHASRARVRCLVLAEVRKRKRRLLGRVQRGAQLRLRAPPPVLGFRSSHSVGFGFCEPQKLHYAPLF